MFPSKGLCVIPTNIGIRPIWSECTDGSGLSNNSLIDVAMFNNIPKRLEGPSSLVCLPTKQSQ